jgi:hypothetical protein
MLRSSITLDDAGRVDLLCSPGMTTHIRDAAYHLAEDPSAGETWDEETRDLLAELGDALSDALDLLGYGRGERAGAPSPVGQGQQSAQEPGCRTRTTASSAGSL